MLSWLNPSWVGKRIKRMDVWDVALVKWSVLAFTLFVVSIWPAFTSWVQSTSPWWFLIAALLFVLRPFYRVYLK